MAAKKKSHLRVVAGGKSPSAAPAKRKQVYAQDIPYVHRTYHEQKLIDDFERRGGGRSRFYPEINVLNSAKGWYRDMIRLARSEGYASVKNFLKESVLVRPSDKRLADAVLAFIEWENKISHGPERKPR